MTFNEILREQRKSLGLTLEEVARAVGVNRSTVQRWESGSIYNLKRDKIAHLAFVLRVSPEYLLGWSDEPTRSVNDDIAAACVDLTAEEQENVLQYIAFVKAQRRKEHD